MAFPQAESRVPTTVGQMYYELVDEDGTIQLRQIRAMAEVKDQDGEQMPRASWAGDLIPILTVDEKSWLSAFLDKYRALAVAELIP